MRKLKIALFSTPWEAVPPIKYGGTELVVYNLAEGLHKNGHLVTVFATGDSKTSAKLEYIHAKAGYRSDISWDDKYFSLLHASYAFAKIQRGGFDLVHNHYGAWGAAFAKLLDKPFVSTYHGDLTHSRKRAGFEFLKKLFQNTPMISISHSQARNTPFKINWVGNVYNGIDISKFDFNDKPKDYFVWMGRFTSDKGAVESILAAKQAGVRLIMAGKIDKFVPADVEYFNKKVRPLIDGDQIKYIGEISHLQKVKLLKNARGLIDAIKWNEPFGLVIIEAMVCGTPVIANGFGSVPEVVADQETGFICGSQKDIVKAIKNIDQIRRHKCRERVEKYFTAEKMTEDYERAYYKILKHKV
ncbi:MAG: glycosyltransferase family 4 protein [Patescibacteria group bacterium]